MLCLIFKVVVHDQRKPQEQHSPFPSHSLKQLRESYHHVPFHLWWHVKGRQGAGKSVVLNTANCLQFPICLHDLLMASGVFVCITPLLCHQP